MTSTKMQRLETKATDRLSALSADLRLLITTMLDCSDIPSVARISRLFRHGWARRSVVIVQGSDVLRRLWQYTKALGDRIGRVHELTIYAGRLDADASDLVADEIGRFIGLTMLRVDMWDAVLVSRVLHQGRLSKLKTLDTMFSHGAGVLTDALIAAPESVRETLVGWSSTMNPDHMMRCPRFWLDRLELLDLWMDEYESNKQVSMLVHQCQSLVTLRLHRMQQRSVFDDDWAEETFGNSRSLEVIDLHGGGLGMSMTGLRAIAKFCPKVRKLRVPIHILAEGDWNGMISVFRSWSDTLRDIVFPIFHSLDASAVPFFEQTSRVCTQLQRAHLVRRLFPLPQPLHDLALSWLLEHPRMPVDTWERIAVIPSLS